MSTIAIVTFSMLVATTIPRPFTTGECGVIASASETFAVQRDAKASQSGLLAVMNHVMAEEHPNAYTKSEADKEMVRGLIKIIYDNPEVSPSQAREVVLSRCLARAIDLPQKEGV